MLKFGPDEYIVYVARKHSFVFFTETTFLFVLALAPLIPLARVETFTKNAIQGVHPESFFWFLYFFWLTILWLVFVYIWTDYYLDCWVITNKHILDIDQHGLFNRKVSTSRLDLIQDITVEVGSIWATFLKYGDIRIQTAGKEREFVFRNVARPEKLREHILREHDTVMEKREAGAMSLP